MPAIDSETRSMPTKLEEDGRYLVIIIDNSESTRDTMVSGKSLFDHQLEAVEEMKLALLGGKARARTEVLTVCFHGAVQRGWYPLEKMPVLSPSDFDFINCTPLLDFLAASLDHIEAVYKAASQQGLGVRCGLMLMSDGLEGVEVGQRPFAVSLTSEEHVKIRMDWFCRRGFFANALAMGADGGLELKSLLMRIGFPEAGIRPTELGRDQLRRAFGDLSNSTFRGMGL